MSEHDDYHSDFSAVGKSMLNVYCNSPVVYAQTYIERAMEPPTPTPVMLEGSVLHAAILEGKCLDEIVACYPESCLKSDGSINGKPAAKFLRDNPGVVCMKEEHHERVKAVYDSFMGHKEIASLVELATHKEQRFDAELYGLPCKCKPDILCDMGDYLYVPDLKCSKMIDPASFKRTARRLRYWAQHVHYSEILQKVFDKPVVFKFWCIETQMPFRIWPYEYPPISIEMARGEHERKVRELAESYRTGIWRDNWSHEVILEPWDFENSELLSDEVQI